MNSLSRAIKEGKEPSESTSYPRASCLFILRKTHQLETKAAQHMATPTKLSPPFNTTTTTEGEIKMPKMLMNPVTGSVDTEENWLAEMKDWETSTGQTQQEQFNSLIEVVQDTQGNWVDLQAARKLMDDDLCEQIHGTVETEQEFFDAYVKAHEEKFDEDFTVN